MFHEALSLNIINKKHIFATLACVQTSPLPQKLCDLRLYKRKLYESFKEGGWAGGGEVSPRKSVVQSACQYDVTSRVSDFQNGEQSVHQREG